MQEEDDLDYRVTADFQGDSITNTMLKHSNTNSILEQINLLDDQQESPRRLSHMSELSRDVEN